MLKNPFLGSKSINFCWKSRSCHVWNAKCVVGCVKDTSKKKLDYVIRFSDPLVADKQYLASTDVKFAQKSIPCTFI